MHERGARHLIDPGKLLASAGRLYGDDMQRLWGEVLPVAAERVRELQGGERLDSPGEHGRFSVAYTPGHASHHVAYLHEESGTVFCGDVGGVRIAQRAPVLAPTPPPDIDLPAWRAVAGADRSLGTLRARADALRALRGCDRAPCAAARAAGGVGAAGRGGGTKKCSCGRLASGCGSRAIRARRVPISRRCRRIRATRGCGGTSRSGEVCLNSGRRRPMSGARCKQSATTCYAPASIMQTVVHVRIGFHFSLGMPAGLLSASRNPLVPAGNMCSWRRKPCRRRHSTVSIRRPTTRSWLRVPWRANPSS